MEKYKQNKDGYFRTSVSVRDSSGDSRRIYLRAKTPEELDNLVRETKWKIERGEICFNGNTPFGRYADEWLEVYKKHSVSKKQYGRYEANLRLHIKPIIGGISLKDIRATHCQKVLNTHAGESKSHVSKIRMTIQQILTQAVEDEYIIKNPATKLTLPDVYEGTHRPITELEREHILKLAETHRAGLWVLTMLYCGLRPSEAIALNWTDIDLKNGTISVTHTLYDKTKTKTPAGKRRVPMPHLLIEKYKEERAITQTTFVFHQKNNASKQHTIASMRCLWTSFKRELDISMGAQLKRNKIILSVVADDLTPYCLRHTCATDYQTAGVPINIAKVLLGHEDIKVTGNIYTDFTAEQEDNIKKHIQEYWQPPKKKTYKLKRNI